MYFYEYFDKKPESRNRNYFCDFFFQMMTHTDHYLKRVFEDSNFSAIYTRKNKSTCLNKIIVSKIRSGESFGWELKKQPFGSTDTCWMNCTFGKQNHLTFAFAFAYSVFNNEFSAMPFRIHIILFFLFVFCIRNLYCLLQVTDHWTGNRLILTPLECEQWACNIWMARVEKRNNEIWNTKKKKKKLSFGIPKWKCGSYVPGLYFISTA